MKRLSGYPNWFFYLLLGTVLLLGLTGLGLLPWLLEFKLYWSLPFALDSGYRLSIVTVHLLAAWLISMLLGALWQSHIRGGWRKRHNLYSGLTLVASLLALVLTGTGLYYLGSEDAQLIASLAHLVLGAGLLLVFALHYVLGRRLRRQQLAQVGLRRQRSQG